MASAKTTQLRLINVPTGFTLGQLAASRITPGGLDTLRDNRAVASTTANKKIISTFSFQIRGIGSDPLRSRHEQFNRAFVAAFPKLLYANPSTSYNDAGFLSIAAFGGQSQIHAIGETSLSPDATKAKIIQLLRNANIVISSEISFDQHTIQELEQGANLTPPVNTADTGRSTNTIHIPGFSYGLPDLSQIKIPEIPKLPDTDGLLESLGKLLGLDSLANSLGLVAGTATVTAVVVGGLFLVVMLKK